MLPHAGARRLYLHCLAPTAAAPLRKAQSAHRGVHLGAVLAAERVERQRVRPRAHVDEQAPEEGIEVDLVRRPAEQTPSDLDHPIREVGQCDDGYDAAEGQDHPPVAALHRFPAGGGAVCAAGHAQAHEGVDEDGGQRAGDIHRQAKEPSVVLVQVADVAYHPLGA